MHLGRWRPREVARETSVEGVELGWRPRLQSVWDLTVHPESQASTDGNLGDLEVACSSSPGL